MVFSPSKENLAIVRHLLHNNMSANQIAARLQCTPQCIRMWKRRFENEVDEGPKVQDLRAGRNVWRKMTDARLELVKEYLSSAEHAFATVKSLPETLNLPVHEKTIRRALKQRSNVSFHYAATKAEIRGADEVARLQYAEAHIDWPEERWRRTICIDEKVFSSSKDGRIGVWRPQGQRFNKRFVKAMRQSGRVTQNYWGWMWHGGKGRLIPLTRNLNAQLYVDLLNEQFYPIVQALFPGRATIYVIEDNCPVHTANIVKDWYRQHPRLVRLPHPPRSPDLNPVENLWSKMVKPWRNVPHDINELRNRVQQSWDELDQNPGYFNNLMDSMPRRFQAVIDNGGSYTKY